MTAWTADSRTWSRPKRAASCWTCRSASPVPFADGSGVNRVTVAAWELWSLIGRSLVQGVDSPTLKETGEAGEVRRCDTAGGQWYLCTDRQGRAGVATSPG